MKKLLKYRVLFLLFISFSTELFGDTFGFINSVMKENAFLVSIDQSATIVKKGDFLDADSQLLVEEGGLVIFSDYFDHKYQLSSGSLVKFKSDGIELLRGVLRVKTLAPSGKLIKVETPNAIISFADSEGSISYNPGTSQTDVISFDGVFELKGKSNLSSSIDVSGGNSSFVREGFQMGMPSVSSKTPSKELEKIASIFLDNPVRTRGVASTKEGKIIVIKAKSAKPSKSHKRSPASEGKATISVPIRIIGSGENRQPSSVPNQPIKPPQGVDFILKDLKSYKMEP